MGCKITYHPIKEGTNLLELPIGSRILSVTPYNEGARSSDAFVNVLSTSAMMSSTHKLILKHSSDLIEENVNDLAFIGTAVCPVIRGYDNYCTKMTLHLFEVLPS